MTPQEIKERASRAPVFVFGSPELEELHRESRGTLDYRYQVYREYVVVHPSCRGSQPFRTLNTIFQDQRVPQIVDIPD